MPPLHLPQAFSYIHGRSWFFDEDSESPEASEAPSRKLVSLVSLCLCTVLRLRRASIQATRPGSQVSEFTQGTHSTDLSSSRTPVFLPLNTRQQSSMNPVCLPE